MDGLGIIFIVLALAAGTFLVLFVAVFLIIVMVFFAIRYLKMALDWLVPPLENRKKSLCSPVVRMN
jgi:hypothetical protein